MTTSKRAEFRGVRPIGGAFTFGGRQGRMSATRQRALDELVPRYAVELPVRQGRRVVVEIGCGKGDTTAAMAPGDAPALVLACEVNSATIAHLAQLLERDGITNVGLWVDDAFALLQALGPAAVDELRIWFPDPWPKPRQATKRLVTTERLAILTDCLRVGGRFRLATDHADYADQALAAIEAEPRLAGGVVARPDDRPVSVFEARGLREGRQPIDLEATRLR